VVVSGGGKGPIPVTTSQLAVSRPNINTDTMETRFKVGDRVTDSSFGNGTVVHFDDEMYVVDFDESKVGLNDCNGHSKNGQGLWIREKYLTSETVAERNNRLIREIQSTPLTFIRTSKAEAMKYTGKLYGRVYGKTFELDHTGQEFIDMQSRIDSAIDLIQKARLNNGNDAMLQDAIIALLPPKR
jgi:hypothetical protein